MKTLLESINDSIDESLSSTATKILDIFVKKLTDLGFEAPEDKLEVAADKLANDLGIRPSQIMKVEMVEDSIAKDLIKDFGTGITINGDNILYVLVKKNGLNTYSYNAEDEVWEEF